MRIREKHALALRLLHWINVPLMIVMIWSGILIYWANDIYPGFFPDWFYRALHIPGRLAEGLGLHFFFAWFLVLNGLLYLLYLALSGHWRELYPGRQAWRDLLPTVLHDIGLRKQAPVQGKFNAAQKIAYSGAIALGALAVFSGLAIYKPVQLNWLAALFGGYEGARLVHFVVMILFCLFIVMHVLQVLRAGWNNFRAMVAGFEVEK